METFVTASTSLTDYDDLPALIFKNNGRANGNTYGGRIGHPGKQQQQQQQQYQQSGFSSSGGRSLHEATLNYPVHVNTGRSPLTFLNQYNPKEQHQAICRVPRNDLIDNLLLRFIRARKWDSERAIEMMSKSLHWRSTDFPADIWAMEGDAPSYLNGTNKGFVHNFTTENPGSKAEIRTITQFSCFKPRSISLLILHWNKTKDMPLLLLNGLDCFKKLVNLLILVPLSLI